MTVSTALYSLLLYLYGLIYDIHIISHIICDIDYIISIIWFMISSLIIIRLVYSGIFEVVLTISTYFHIMMHLMSVSHEFVLSKLDTLCMRRSVLIYTYTLELFFNPFI